MKRLILCSLIGFFFFNSYKSLSNSQEKNSDKVILVVGKDTVLTEEFAYVYKKNNQKANDAFTKNSVNSYLELYKKFKLKVVEAEALKLDTHQTFIKELDGYIKQLSKPYLTEKKVTDKLLKEVYERKKQYVNASHILILVDATAAPKDTIKAYNKINEIYKKALKGNFEELAVEYSEDPSAHMTGKLGYQGNLDYFTALDMVYEFENAAYTTSINKISKPFRTQFGYHILKVHDRKTVPAKVKVAHIMINAADGVSKEDSIIAKNKIDEIHKKASQGEDWKELCLQFSDHVKTKNNAGELFPFAFRRDLGIPAFENIAYSMSKAGEISEPIHTPYGWHIIKFIEKVELASFDDYKKELNQKIAKDSRSKLSQKAFYKRLKKENSFKENANNKALIINNQNTTKIGNINESLIQNTWTKGATQNNAVLFSIQKKNYTIDQFLTYIEKYQSSKKSVNLNYKLRLLYEDFVNKSLYDYEEAQLSSKYFSYKMLVKEYREGMLLFQLMSDKVWNKALKDTTGLRSFYEKQKQNHVWQERARVSIYDADSRKTLKSLKKTLKKEDLTKKELLQKFNKESSLTLSIKEGKYEKSAEEILKDIKWKKGKYTISKNNRTFYVIVHEIIPSTTKELKDIKGLMISEYQNYLEKEWLNELKEKYPIQVIEKEVKTLVQE